jgi:hypothetical protein
MRNRAAATAPKATTGAKRDRPRLVIVTRKTGLLTLIERHGTVGQARFYLERRGQDFGEVEAAHARETEAIGEVLRAIPPDQRRTRVDRGDLDRFLFAPDDVVLVVGQDGLIANAAKYLAGQLTIGVNPDRGRFDGVLCRHAPAELPELLAWLDDRSVRFSVERRAMALALREDGQRLLALNELFVGHRSHQSARYRIELGAKRELQSSSGLICATGTGSTGWARSIATQRGLQVGLPRPEERSLAWFVREPFPSVATGTAIDHGRLGAGESLLVASQMGEGGVVFADGMEWDALEFLSGQSVRIGLAETPLQLVVPAPKHRAPPSPPSLRSPPSLPSPPRRPESRAQRPQRPGLPA